MREARFSARNSSRRSAISELKPRAALLSVPRMIAAPLFALHYETSVTLNAPPARWLGKLFGSTYARWCAARMTSDAAAHFASSTGAPG